MRTQSNLISIIGDTSYEVSDNDIILHNPHCFSLDLTLDCGQAFRWNKNMDGRWCSVVKGKYIELLQEENKIIFFRTGEEDFKNIWIPYFDLTRDYDEICETLKADANIAQAIKEYYGIRILNQEPWETLCSFIISQNNNIPRIKGIINRLCETYGDAIYEVDENGQTTDTIIAYSFPDAERIAQYEEADLVPLRAGFRNKYIIDAARKVSDGTVDLCAVKELPLCDAEAKLIEIKGVGAKVAQCALLYGLEHIDGFPIDVWVKRIMSEMYPDGLPECTSGIRGIAQQYLFHWRRNSPLFNEVD